jgi:DNA segregation ATPase FtsK/SpoIIIE-like protein
MLLGMIVLSVGFAFILGLSVNSNPERQALALEEAATVQPWKIASRVTGYVVFGVVGKVGLAVMGGYVVFYVIAIGRNWLDLHARQVHARDGLFPVIEIQRGVLYDPNRDNAGAHPLITAAALSVQKQAATKADKILVRQIDRPAIRQEDAHALEVDPVNLPDLVRLADVARNPTLDALTLGVSEKGAITASLHDLMHVLAVGASGFGKSAFLRALIWQLAQVQEPLDVVAIDINGSEFNPIRSWARLLYPVARETDTAIATLQAVKTEIDRRKVLYEAFPSAFDLTSYNRLADNPLAPVVILADEATNLLNQDGLGDPLREVTQTARQYGVYLLLAGQSAKHNIIDTQTRDNFSSRFCFHTSPSSRRVVLGESVDDVTKPGRAWAQLTGAQLQQIQVPYVTREELARVLEVGQPRRVLDLAAVKVAKSQAIEDDETLSDPERVKLLDAQGVSHSEIERRVYGFNGGSAYCKVKDILSE